MTEISIRGTEKLAAAGRALQAGGRDLPRKLREAFEKTGRPILADVYAGVETLPQSGGLAARVAGGRFSASPTVHGSDIDLQIKAESNLDLEALDRGVLNHPVFGGPAWVVQSVGPGWFTKPASRGIPRAQSAVAQAVKDLANQIERSAS